MTTEQLPGSDVILQATLRIVNFIFEADGTTWQSDITLVRRMLAEEFSILIESDHDLQVQCSDLPNPALVTAVPEFEAARSLPELDRVKLLKIAVTLAGDYSPITREEGAALWNMTAMLDLHDNISRQNQAQLTLLKVRIIKESGLAAEVSPENNGTSAIVQLLMESGLVRIVDEDNLLPPGHPFSLPEQRDT